MQHDDEDVGYVLSRRELLASLASSGAAMVVPPGWLRGAAGRLVTPGGMVVPACVVRPAQTEGPYFVDGALNRSDIRSDPGDGTLSEGAPLRLAFRVSRLDGGRCAPLPGALVDVWQCDALGVYSGVRDFNGLFDTTGKTFLRGHQATGPDGVASFRTIYPGWYEGRTVHIHFKIRTDPASSRGAEFTSQLYFDDALSDRVFTRSPYVARAGRRTRNEADSIFRRGGGQLLLDVATRGEEYAATFDLGMQLG